jgi:hypothetical protein
VAYLSAVERRSCEAAARLLMPPGDDPVTEPGAVEAGAVDYVEATLSAFDTDPPRIWAGGPFSDRAGSAANHFADFLPLGRIEDIAWRRRIAGWQDIYRGGLAGLGADFADQAEAEQRSRLTGQPALRDLLFEHCCEGMYAAPEYGGNRNLAGWQTAGYEGDVLPRGWTDDEVSHPLGRAGQAT